MLAQVIEKLYLCESGATHQQATGLPTARRIYANWNSKLYFCADKLRSPSLKSPCQHLRSWGTCHLATQ